MEPANVEDIRFSSKSSVIRKSRDIDPPTEDELEKFYCALNSSQTKPAILKITPPYSKEFIPHLTDPSLPVPISQLYDPETLTLGYLCLLKKCEEVARGLSVCSYHAVYACLCTCVRTLHSTYYNIMWHKLQVSLDQVTELERSTKEQAKSKLWNIHREGRITASNFKAVVKTNPCMPAESLIKKICYPQAYKFSTEATR